jgi:hypothetical protein
MTPSFSGAEFFSRSANHLPGQESMKVEGRMDSTEKDCHNHANPAYMRMKGISLSRVERIERGTIFE